MNIDEYYMSVALEEAVKSFRNKNVPVGAVVVLNDKIFRGRNKRYKRGFVTSHAEIEALNRACKKNKDFRLDNAVLYVTLYPCPMCASAIVQSRIKKVIIGANSKDLKNNYISKMIFESANIEVVENILHDDCSNLLSMFFENERSKNN